MAAAVGLDRLPLAGHPLPTDPSAKTRRRVRAGTTDSSREIEA
jgi:hypothetical protein